MITELSTEREQKGRPIPAVPQEWGLLSTDPMMSADQEPSATTNTQTKRALFFPGRKVSWTAAPLPQDYNWGPTQGSTCASRFLSPHTVRSSSRQSRRPPCIPLAVQDKPNSTRKHRTTNLTKAHHELDFSPHWLKLRRWVKQNTYRSQQHLHFFVLTTEKLRCFYYRISQIAI